MTAIVDMRPDNQTGERLDYAVTVPDADGRTDHPSRIVVARFATRRAAMLFAECHNYTRGRY